MKKNQNEILTAYCGLYCGDCFRYASKASDFANQLIAELGNIRFQNYAKIKKGSIKTLRYYDLFFKILQEIKKLKCNRPCKLGGDGC